MNFQEVFTAANGSVIGGQPVDWNCWGENLVYVAFGKESIQIASCVTNNPDQRVFALEVFDVAEAVAWRWVDPEFQSQWLKECVDRSIDSDWAWNGCKFQSIESASEILKVLNQVAPENDPT